jgi:hypothetical protein
VNDEDLTNTVERQSPQGLQISLEIEDDTLNVTAHNGFDHAIGFPKTLEPFRSIFFEERTKSGVYESHPAIIVTPPSMERLALVKLEPGETITSSEKIRDVTMTPLPSILEMRVNVSIPRQEDRIAGTEPWSGDLWTEWQSVTPEK